MKHIARSRYAWALLLIAAFALSGCAAPAARQERTPTAAAAADSTMAKASQDAEDMEKMASPTTEAISLVETPGSADMATSAVSPTPDDMMVKEVKTPEAMADPAAPPAAEAAMSQKAAAAMPGWLSAELTDVNTGESFRLSDLKGKVVLVEMMAVWCPTCLRQQREIASFHKQAGQDGDLVSVALDIDPNETAQALGGHTAKHGFDWKFAVAGPAVARELANLYGNQFINPPSAPMLVIDREGGVHPLPFGVKSAESLAQAVEPFLAEGM